MAVAGTTTFVGIMRPFPMSTELLLLDADFVVSAASAATLALLGIDASALLPRHTAEERQRLLESCLGQRLLAGPGDGAV